MSVIRLERISSESPVYRLAEENGQCVGCAGCGTGNRSVELSHLSGNLAQIEMSQSDQWRMLSNSWLKPLMALILTSAFCSMLSLPEGLDVFLMTAAFLTGLFLCREVPVTALRAREVFCSEEINENE